MAGWHITIFCLVCAFSVLREFAVFKDIFFALFEFDLAFELVDFKVEYETLQFGLIALVNVLFVKLV